jgi:hypothetical protein
MASSDPPIHRVPLEVFDKIFDGVASPLDRIAFACASDTLSNRYYLPAIVSKLNLHKLRPEIDRPAVYLRPQLFCLSDVVQGKPGFAPFFISSVDLSSDRKKITVGITSPIFAELKKDIPTRSYMFVDLDDGPRATLYNEYTFNLMDEILDGVFATMEADFEYWEDDMREPVGLGRAPIDRDLKVNTKKVDWKMTMAGRLVPASVELLKERFKCKECKGTDEIEVDEATVARYVRTVLWSNSRSYHLTRRWPDLPRAYQGYEPYDPSLHMGFEISCPRCKGYEVAMEQLGELIEGFENSSAERAEEFDAYVQGLSEEEYNAIVNGEY